MSNKKKQGVKRGSKEHEARQLSMIERMEYNTRFERNIGQCINDQEICVALGRMGFRQGDYFKLQETLVSLRKEYAEEFLTGAEVDKSLVYEKSRFDREFNQYVPKCMQRTWEERNDLGRHTLGLRVGPADNRPEEMETYIKEYGEWKAKNEIRAFKAAQTRARKKAVNRKAAELQEAYDRGYADGLKAAGIDEDDGK